jgi:polyhydroxyalkanoate synthase subunit PhaC
VTGAARDGVWLSSSAMRRALTAVDELRRSQGRRMDLLGFGPQPSPSQVLLATPTFRIRSFAAGPTPGPPLLLVAAPIKRAYIWDLAPEASTVRLLAEAGFAVHLLEWLDPGAAHEDHGLDAYADLLLGEAVATVGEASGDIPVLVGHSLGGTLAAIFSARHPEQARGLVLLESPLHFGPDAGAFAPLVAASPDAWWLEDAFGAVPGTFLDLASTTAAPRSFVYERCLDLATSLAGPGLQMHLRVQRWALDELAMPGRLLAEIVEDLYRNDRFMAAELVIGGRPVGPASLVTPMLSVVNPASDVIPPSSVVPFHEAAATAVKEVLWYHGDQGVALQHVGILVGRTAHAELWPRIIAWARLRY